MPGLGAGQVNIMSMKLMGFLGVKQSEDSIKVDKKLKEYERYMKSGELLDLRFSQSVRTEGLRYMDGEVEVFLPKEEINPQYANSFLPGDRLNRYYAVKVMDINRVAKRVIVSHVAAQKDVRPSMLQEIDAVLAEGKVFKTQAIVVLVSRSNCVFVDILGLGIRGMILVKDWSVTYIPSLAAVTQRGEVIDIAITGHSDKHTDEKPQYLCSRKIRLEERDLWKGLETRIPQNSTVLVRCQHKESRNFVGKIVGLDEISAYCFYPDKPSRRTGETIVIQQGGLYNAFVSAIDEQKHILRLRIIDEVEVPVKSS